MLGAVHLHAAIPAQETSRQAVGVLRGPRSTWDSIERRGRSKTSEQSPAPSSPTSRPAQEMILQYRRQRPLQHRPLLGRMAADPLPASQRQSARPGLMQSTEQGQSPGQRAHCLRAARHRSGLTCVTSVPSTGWWPWLRGRTPKSVNSPPSASASSAPDWASATGHATRPRNGSWQRRLPRPQ